MVCYIIGKSGSGKFLIDLLLKLISPIKGEIKINESIGYGYQILFCYVPEHMLSDSTILDNIKLGNISDEQI